MPVNPTLGNHCRCAPATTRRTLVPMRARRLIPLVITVALATAACGGGDDDTTTDAPAATTITASEQPAAEAEPSAPAETEAPAPAETSPGQPADVGQAEGAEPGASICASVLSPEAVSSVVGEPFAAGEDLTDLTGDPQQCQFVSDTGVFVGFSWLSEELGSGVHAEIREQGTDVAEYSNPALPDTFAYANTVSVLHEGRYWEVQVVNPFVAPNSPELFDLAGQLLVAWLDQAG